MVQKRDVTLGQGQINKDKNNLVATVSPLFSFLENGRGRVLWLSGKLTAPSQLPLKLLGKVLATLVLSPWQGQTLLSDIDRALHD